MTDNHLFALIRGAVKSPSKVFVETDKGDEVTYGDVLDRSAQIARMLTGLGVLPGDRVAVQVEKSVEALMLYLGTIRAGAVFLPLNTGYTAAEVGYFLENAEPTLFVCDPAKRRDLAPLAQEIGVPHLETLDAAGGGSLPERWAVEETHFTDVPRAPDDLAAILYTSGTTGRSKGAMLSHDNLASNALALREAWRFTEDDVLIHALPIFHTHGLFVATNITLIAGGSMIFLPKFDPDRILALMPRATSLMGVPTFYTRLLAHPGLTREAAATMRLFVSGSAPLLAETHTGFRERTGHAILERYGMTETNMNTSNPYDGERRPGTVGFPLPGISVRIAHPEKGAEVQRGEIGVIEVNGPNVFKGYWRMPEKTAAEFRSDGYFISGDLAMIDADGYVTIVGRAKDLIISGGFNVYPKEIESEINALAGVAESAVIGLPHADLGEGVTAVVVAQPNGTVTGDQIIAQLNGKLARFKQPKQVLFVDALPVNAMGKVQKNVLRDRFQNIYVQNAGIASG
ncbi:MAG: malonyl-CoA synthase [Pseudomonadota bacterium]